MDDQVECANCRGLTWIGDALYDERGGIYFCDTQCYYEWADANFEIIADYYYHGNIL